MLNETENRRVTNVGNELIKTSGYKVELNTILQLTGAIPGWICKGRIGC